MTTVRGERGCGGGGWLHRSREAFWGRTWALCLECQKSTALCMKATEGLRVPVPHHRAAAQCERHREIWDQPGRWTGTASYRACLDGARTWLTFSKVVDPFPKLSPIQEAIGQVLLKISMPRPPNQALDIKSKYLRVEPKTHYFYLLILFLKTPCTSW